MEDVTIVEGPIPLSARSRFRIAVILAIAADALQIFVFPLFSEGALSPADDVLDLAVGVILVRSLVGIGNFCQHSRLNSCRESIWFRSGHLLSRMFTPNGNSSRQRERNRGSKAQH